MSVLDNVIEEYQNALKSVFSSSVKETSIQEPATSESQTQKTNDSISKVEKIVDDPSSELMRVLIARTALAQVLTLNKSIDSKSLRYINDLDKELKEIVKRFNNSDDHLDFTDWRAIVQPPESAWWWYLDENNEKAKTKLNYFWTVFRWPAWILIVIALTILIEFAKRFLTGNLDILSTVLQGFLTFLVGGSIYQGVKQFFEGTGRASGKEISKSKQSPSTAFVILFLLCVVPAGFIMYRLPDIVQKYSDQCHDDYYEGNYTSAIKNCELAIKLQPGDAESHYNLGSSYEQFLEYDKATSEYQTAILANNEFHAPYINLARLHMLRRNDFSGALSLLNKALTLKIDAPEKDKNQFILYPIYKNRGWANLGLKFYKQAEEDLSQALEFRPDGAEAHYLMALVMEAQNRRDRAVDEWKECEYWGTQHEEEIEPSWLGQARERLKQGEAK
jgi:tetratricopeptide (TPR) repeat protein